MLNSSSRYGGPSFLVGLFALVCAGALAAADLNITQVVNYNGQTATMRLTRQNLRGPNFELLQQVSDGSYTPVTHTAERSYLGTVDEYPGAVASGILTEAGVFRGLIIFDRGNQWFTQGATVHRTLGWDVVAPYKYPTLQATPGQVGTATTHLEVAYDYTSGAYTNLGGTMAKALEEAEYDMSLQRALYMTNILVRPYLSRIIVRADASQDPYAGLSTGAFLSAVRTEWQTNQSTIPRNLVAGIGAGVSGLAGGTGFGFDGGYFVQPWGGNGYTWGFVRHEMGHCFGMGHEDGGGPEGGTINSHGNIYARMSTSEVKVALNRRDSRASEMTTEGTFTGVNLPPYACMDAVTTSCAPHSTVMIDVLANDHDANNQTRTIQSFETTSKLGATVSLSVGTGPGGRNQLALQRLVDHGQEDTFSYRIQDSSGQTATGIVIARGEAASTKLTGTLIGSTGSWGGNLANTKVKAVDGNLTTFYDAVNASGDWVGLDLGSANTKIVTKVAFAPRSSFEGRMDGGKIQASNTADFGSGVVTLHTISGAPPAGSLTVNLINNTTAYRYVRYLGPDNGSCNVAEIEFWGSALTAPNPPNGRTATGASGGAITLAWNPSPYATSYRIKRSTVSGGPYTTIAVSVTATTYTDTTTVSGQRYYYVIAAENSFGVSGNSAQIGVSAIPSPTSAWKFSEGYGGIAADSSPAGNHGTIAGVISWGSGVDGGALQFNGSNSFVKCGTGPSVSGTSDFTVAAWIKTTSTANGIIVQQRDTHGYNGEYMLSATSTGKIAFMVFGNNAYQFDFATPQSINDGAWHHVVAVRNGLTGFIYIDGSPTPAATANGTAVRSMLSNLATIIGRDTLDNNKNFNGSIDEVHVYKNVALTGTEVQGLYNSSFDPDSGGPANLIEWLIGTDPLASTGGGHLSAKQFTASEIGLSDGKTYLGFTARVRKDRTGVTLTAQAAATPQGLSSEEAAGHATQAGAPVDDGDFEIFRWYYDVPIEDGRAGFMRLRVVRE
ncbi:MAG: LamG-like jellyroll fold domain-containing protein [Verrucomicrobiota bacterium]